MKKIIWILMFLFLINVAYAVTSDWYLRDTYDVSAYIDNLQGVEWLPGGFDVIDWKATNSSYVYKLDASGVFWNLTNQSTAAVIPTEFNLSNLSGKAEHVKITSIRYFNQTGNDNTLIVLDDINKSVFRVNATDFHNYTATKFNFASNCSYSVFDDLAGMCTNGSTIWVAIKDRDVVNIFERIHAGGDNLSNTSGEFAIPLTNNVGGLDCIENASQFFILDDVTSMVYITKEEDHTFVVDSVNLSNLTGQPTDSFTDISVSTSTNFYVTSNSSDSVYRISKYVSAIRDIYSANLSFSYPARDQSFYSRFYLRTIAVNFSAAQSNRTRSFFTSADKLNCSLFVNSTYNSTILATNNLSVNNTFNISCSPGDYKLEIKCLANISYAKSISDFKIIHVYTYKHLFWMNDNFSIWYNSQDNQFEGAIGNSTSLLEAPFNYTVNDPFVLRLIWDNTTGNRTIYLNGVPEVSDTKYSWHIPTQTSPDRILIGSRNDSGQLNGIISYFMISNKALASEFSEGDWLSSWTTGVKKLTDLIDKSFFYQFRVILKRFITTEQPILKFVNISYDETLMNFTLAPGISFLDFSFASGDDHARPGGQTASMPIFSIWNTGNVSFALQAKSLTPFDDCFTVMLFNESDSLIAGAKNNTMNLSTTATNFSVAGVKPGENVSIWMNVSASGCGPYSEFFDIDFDTVP